MPSVDQSEKPSQISQSLASCFPDRWWLWHHTEVQDLTLRWKVPRGHPYLHPPVPRTAAWGAHNQSPGPTSTCSAPGRPQVLSSTVSRKVLTQFGQKSIIIPFFTDGKTEVQWDCVTQVLRGGQFGLQSFSFQGGGSSKALGDHLTPCLLFYRWEYPV